MSPRRPIQDLLFTPSSVNNGAVVASKSLEFISPRYLKTPRVSPRVKIEDLSYIKYTYSLTKSGSKSKQIHNGSTSYKRSNPPTTNRVRFGILFIYRWGRCNWSLATGGES